MQNIKKFIDIKNPGWLDQYSVISEHPHRDQFCLHSAPMAVFVTGSRNHIHITRVTHDILQKHHIYINGSKIIFQDSQFLSLL